MPQPGLDPAPNGAPVAVVFGARSRRAEAVPYTAVISDPFSFFVRLDHYCVRLGWRVQKAAFPTDSQMKPGIEGKKGGKSGSLSSNEQVTSAFSESKTAPEGRASELSSALSGADNQGLPQHMPHKSHLLSFSEPTAGTRDLPP